MRQKTISTFLIFLYLLNFSILPTFAYDSNPVSAAAVKTTKIEGVSKDLNKKLRKKYSTVKVTINNNSDKDLMVNGKIFIIDSDKDQIELPTTKDVLKKIKLHPYLRTLLIGTPGTLLGVAIIFGSFGTLIEVGYGVMAASTVIPFTCAQGKNELMKKDINKIYYNFSNIKSHSSESAYVFIPNRIQTNELLIKGLNFKDAQVFDAHVIITDDQNL